MVRVNPSLQGVGLRLGGVAALLLPLALRAGWGRRVEANCLRVGEGAVTSRERTLWETVDARAHRSRKEWHAGQKAIQGWCTGAATVSSALAREGVLAGGFASVASGRQRDGAAARVVGQQGRACVKKLQS